MHHCNSLARGSDAAILLCLEVRGAAACKWGAAAAATRVEKLSVAKLSDEQRELLSATAEASGSPCALCGDMPEDAVVSLCNHLYCRQCIYLQVSLIFQILLPTILPSAKVPSLFIACW